MCKVAESGYFVKILGKTKTSGETSSSFAPAAKTHLRSRHYHTPAA